MSMRALVMLVVFMTGCACDDEGYCPEPELVPTPRTCQFYQGHSVDVPDLLCHVSNAFHDPILTSGSQPVLVDGTGGIWVPARHRTDDRGNACGTSFGVIQSQQYRPGWNATFPDCVWVACSEYADINSIPRGAND